MVQTEKGCCIRAKLICFIDNRTKKNYSNYKKCRIVDLIIGHVDYRSIPTLKVLLGGFLYCWTEPGKLFSPASSLIAKLS